MAQMIMTKKSKHNPDTTFLKLYQALKADTFLPKTIKKLEILPDSVENTIIIKGDGLSGTVIILPTSEIVVKLDLGFMLGMFKGRIKKELDLKIDKALA